MKYFFLIFLLFSCAHRNQNLADKLMYESTHEEMIGKFEDPARDEWQKPYWIISEMGELKGKNVIDIGSGSGYFARKFFDKGANVTAADVDEKFLKHLKQFESKGFKVKEIKFDDPKMGSNFYHYAFTSNTYHHIDHRVKYLKKVLKGLKKNGKLVIVDFKPSIEPNDNDKTGPRNSLRVPVYKVVRELMEAGFDKVSIDRVSLPKQYLIIATK